MFVAGATLPVWILSLLAALLFDQAFRGRDIVKAAFFLPVLPPIVVVAVIWRVLLHPNGVMTWLIGGRWGMTEIRWLADAVLAPLSMIAVHDWAAIPFFMVIWLAGLAGIPAELREAAALDGAGSGAHLLVYRAAAPARDRRAGGCAVLDQCIPGIRAAIRAADRPRRTGEFDAGARLAGAEIRVPVFPHGRRGRGLDGDVRDDPARHDRAAAVQPPCVSVPFRLLIAVAAAAIFAFPIWFMVTSAFKAEAEVQAIPMHFLPHDFQGFAQFRQAAEIAPLWRYFLNSWIYAASHVGVTVFFGALAGFGFAKYRFPGRTLLFLAVLSTIMVPFQVLVVPLFIEVKWFGWENSYAGLIIPGMMNAFGVFMMRQYASDLPDELIEAARVDGAGEFHIFLRIALPLLLPALASLAIIVFIWSWGNFLWPLVIVQDKDLNVLSVGLTSYSQPYQREPMWGAAMAASTVATLPIAALFVFFQRYFVKGLTAAAVKG